MVDRFERAVAVRVFSDGFIGAEVVEREEGEYAPQYIKLATGQLVNRVFVCGALIDKEDVGTDSAYWKLIVSDQNGAHRAHVGEYQPDALLAIQDISVPSFVSMVCKVKSNEYNDVMYFQLSPESVNEVDEATYDRWVQETTEQTEARKLTD